MITIDSKLEYTDDVLKNFRCDLIFIYGPTLFIVEHKYLFGKDEDLGLAAIKCIEERKYVERVTLYIATNYPDVYKILGKVIGLGFGYTLHKDEIKTYARLPGLNCHYDYSEFVPEKHNYYNAFTETAKMVLTKPSAHV